MLKKIINSARIDLDIIPLDPLLIKSGIATVGGVDMSFVRTYHNNGEEEPFIPGSSLKGMIRSYAEKICRSLKNDPVPVCLPYLDPRSRTPLQKGEERQFSCGFVFEKYKKNKKITNIPSPDAYRCSCPACRLFGSQVFIGRFATSDAYLSEKYRKEVGKPVFEIRDGVAIDRLTGGAAGGAKYDLEVLTRGDFSTSIEIRNFERWQLGLVALVLRDMEEGLVRLGFSKSRGLGRFKADITNFTVSYFNQPPAHLVGMASVCSEKECLDYGFSPESSGKKYSIKKFERKGLRYECDLTQNWKTALESGVDDFVKHIEQSDWPAGLETYTNRRAG